MTIKPRTVFVIMLFVFVVAMVKVVVDIKNAPKEFTTEKLNLQVASKYRINKIRVINGAEFDLTLHDVPGRYHVRLDSSAPLDAINTNEVIIYLNGIKEKGGIITLNPVKYDHLNRYWIVDIWISGESFKEPVNLQKWLTIKDLLYTE